MRSLDDLVSAHAFTRSHMVAKIVILLIICAAVWAYFTRIDEVAVAEGAVVPQGQVKVIQHLEGGIVEEIHVTDGQPVSTGDPLVRLTLGLNAANKAEIQIQIDGLLVKRARLRAEAEGTPLKFPADLGNGMADIVESERETYASRKREIESSLELLRKQTRQRELEVRELETKLKGREANLRLALKRFAMSKDLVKNDLVPKIEHLALENEVETLRSTVSEFRSSLPKVREALAEAKEREVMTLLNFRSGVREEMGQVEVAIARNRELLARATDQATRTAINSPIDGIVKNLRYHTIGGVVRPGEAIMEIVPSREKLVVEAKLNPVDVGYVRVGQPAVVKLLTYDFVRYGGLDGTVVNVAPDSTLDREGNPYFRVVIETAKSYVGDTPGSLPITPGMNSIVDIHTGDKSLLTYLIAPVLKLKHEAFRER